MWIASLLEGKVIIRLDTAETDHILYGWWRLARGVGPHADLMLLKHTPGNIFQVVKWRYGDVLDGSHPIVAEIQTIIVSFKVLQHTKHHLRGLVEISEADQVLLRLMADFKR